VTYWPGLSQENKVGLWRIKQATKRPITRMVNEIIAKYLNGELKEASKMKITEIEVMVSKKKSINFNSWAVSYSTRATLDENDPSHLEALVALKDQLASKVAEALNGNGNGNGKAGIAHEEAQSEA